MIVKRTATDKKREEKQVSWDANRHYNWL